MQLIIVSNYSELNGSVKTCVDLSAVLLGNNARFQLFRTQWLGKDCEVTDAVDDRVTGRFPTIPNSMAR